MQRREWLWSVNPHRVFPCLLPVGPKVSRFFFLGWEEGLPWTLILVQSSFLLFFSIFLKSCKCQSGHPYFIHSNNYSCGYESLCIAAGMSQKIFFWKQRFARALFATPRQNSIYSFPAKAWRRTCGLFIWKQQGFCIFFLFYSLIFWNSFISLFNFAWNLRYCWLKRD